MTKVNLTTQYEENSVVEFVNYTTIIGPITNNDENSYLEEINNLA